MPARLPSTANDSQKTERPTRRRRRLAPQADRSTAASAPQSAATTETATSEPRTWKQDLADVQRVGFWLWLTIFWLPTLSLSALSGPDVPSMVWKIVSSGDLGAEESLALWNVLVLTAPLTTTVALIGVAVLRGWFQRDDWFQAFYLAMLLLTATTLASTSLRIGQRVELHEISPVNMPPISWAIDLAYSYALVYTPWMAISSLALGSFLAWTWASKVIPHLQSSQS